MSLPEAAYFYLGLSVQALVRASALRKLPVAILVLWTFCLLWRTRGRPDTYWTVGGYLASSLILLALFWPESLIFGSQLGHLTASDQVASYAASQDDGAEVITAADTGQVPPAMDAPVVIPPGTRLVLRVLTETPLALARVINAQTHKTFASLMPMAWFLEIQLPPDVTAAIGDFTHACYLPTLLETLQGQSGRTIDELLPFGNTPLYAQLKQHSVVPSTQSGLVWMSGPNPGNTTPCDVYLQALLFQAQAWLRELKSPRGTPYLELFEQELHLDPDAQAGLLLYREMLYAAGPGVPAPSLAASYAKIQAGNALSGALGGAGTGLVQKGWIGAGWGALTGLLKGSLSGLQHSLDGLSWLVSAAMVLVWYSPYVLGFLNTVLLGLMPFIILWALIPGAQLEPLLHYFVALLLTCSAPLWFALVDQVARLGAQHPPVVDGAMGVAWQAFITTGLWSASLTALGLLLVPVALGLVYFVSFRTIGNLWRGGL